MCDRVEVHPGEGAILWEDSEAEDQAGPYTHSLEAFHGPTWKLSMARVPAEHGFRRAKLGDFHSLHVTMDDVRDLIGDRVTSSYSSCSPRPIEK